MKIDYLFLIVSQITRIVFGGLPLSDPFGNAVNGKIMPYNLIDTDPSCYYEDGPTGPICPMFPPGGELSVFPNNEEKYQHLLHNVHRMHTNCSLMLPIAKYLYGGNVNGGYAYYCQSCKYCGDKDTAGRKPLYWYSDANQAARFKQWDENNCNQAWYQEPDVTPHHTCKWGNTNKKYWPSVSTVPQDRCACLGGPCDFSTRSSVFCMDKDQDKCWFETEGICGGNSCLFDGHCEPVFAAKYDYVGKGFVAGMNGVDAVYSRFTKEIWYLLPIAAHFDERIVIAPADYNINGKYFNLMLEYHDANNTQKPVNCYALYDGDYHDLRVYVSNREFVECPLPAYDPIPAESVWLNWFTKNYYSVIFYEQFLPHIGCEPYAFICKTSLDNFFRLPEENIYYFGTSWIDWEWSDYVGMGYDECHEQHYYNHDTEGWTANGGPTLDQNDIWFYHSGNNCVGCNKIQVLQCLENCILTDDLSPQCKSACQGGATPAPVQTTPAPTRKPTTNPTQKPTNNPTNNPTQKPTNNPTQKPTNNPTQKPTNNPTRKPIIEPTDSPTRKPTDSPSKRPTNNPTQKPTTTPTFRPTETPNEDPTKSPTNNPTQKPTNNPTKNPIQNPTKTPTFIPSESPTESPTKKPTETPVVAPTITPTITTGYPTQKPSQNPTETPTIATTQDEETTCQPEIDWYYRWGRVGTWNEEQLGPLYKSVAEEKFIENNPNCGEFNIDDGFEYYYYFFWGGKTQPNKKKLFIYMHVCCGQGRTFGPNYHMSETYENNENYRASAAWNNRYGSGGLEHEDEWTNVKNFGIKQYIVFVICGLLIIGCCLGCIFGFKYYKKKKNIRQGTKSRGSKKNLAKTIQMHGLSSFPGPKHVQLPSYGRDSTDGSTDGNNIYQSKFVHAVNDSTDGSSAQGDGGNVNTLAPPMMKMGHQHLPSRSVDSLDIANMDGGNTTGVGLPPPVPQDVQDRINELETQDIADAFEIDI